MTHAFPDSGFPASTQVHTPEGLVSIGQLRAGDLVASKDVTTGASGFWPVLETHELPASTLWTFTIFDGTEEEGTMLCRLGQRFWVPPEDLADPQFLPPREGPPAVWAPISGNRSDWGSLRGWVHAGDLTFGDQWIDARTVTVAAGWGHWKRWVVKTDRPQVAWVPHFSYDEVGYEITFDGDGAAVAYEDGCVQTFDERGDLHRFQSPTRQLVVDRGHSFRVGDVGLLAADHVQIGGELVDISGR